MLLLLLLYWSIFICFVFGAHAKITELLFVVLLLFVVVVAADYLVVVVVVTATLCCCWLVGWLVDWLLLFVVVPTYRDSPCCALPLLQLLPQHQVDNLLHIVAVFPSLDQL